MTRKHIKFWLLGAAAIAVISGAGFAADDHGHGHGHEAGEESHDSPKTEEHGHDHDDDHGDDDGHGHGGDEHGDEHGHEEGAVHLTPAQIDAAGIRVAPVTAGTIGKSVNVPGRIVPDENRMAQVTPKITGTVTSVKKNLGDTVQKGDVLAEIESREMADAAAEYQAAVKSEELTRSMLSREKTLWERKITAEQEYLNARNAHQEAAIKTDLARQKLRALGYDDAALKRGLSRFHILAAPVSGRIIDRNITPGAFADTGKAAFTVADLSVVWVDIALPPGDIAAVREGQPARIVNGTVDIDGKVIFISPAINPDTGAAKAIIEIPNTDGSWRPGLFVTAAIATGNAESANALTVPRDAIQTIEGKPSVFVRTDEGFMTRPVTTGRSDGTRIEIISGVAPGETIAVTGTFTIKAELGKSEAEHVH